MCCVIWQMKPVCSLVFWILLCSWTSQVELKMYKNIKILVITGLLVLVSKFVKTGEIETLEDIFGSAIAKTTKSFESLTSKLKSGGALNSSSWNSSCLKSENNATSLSRCLQEFAGVSKLSIKIVFSFCFFFFWLSGQYGYSSIHINVGYIY